MNLTPSLGKVAYLSKKIEEAFIVWFESSNQWAQLDEHQWFVFNQYIKNIPKEQVIKTLVKRFPLPEVQAILFVDNLYDSIPKLLNPEFDLPTFNTNADNIINYRIPKSKKRSYLYNGKGFQITFGTPFLEKYIHLPFAHLECSSIITPTLEFEVFQIDNRYALRIGGDQKRSLVADEPGQIKRLLYIELVNYFFDKKGFDWLTFIHGSALRMNKQVIILTSEGGSGKSTMAGLLLLNGFEYFSDDFIPVDFKSRKAFPFPAALCIKNDAISILESMGLRFSIKTPKQTAYVDFKQNSYGHKPASIKSVVFIKYSEGSDLSFNQVTALEALPHFLQESWVGNDMKRAKSFISWFAKLKFYKLVYGNNDKAIETLTNLMKASE